MPPDSPPPRSVPPITRGEGIWLAVAVIAGAVLRLGNLQHVAVEHFDEAVYASNLLFPAEQGGEYPFRQLYAPPLLPAAIEWTTIFGQMALGEVPAWWPMLPALICGLATVPSLWWIARQWFSPRAGIIAALLIAFHEFHAAYCRTALTDVPLSLFVLWAVHRFWIALQTGRTRDAVIAGAVTSLAWWTKYNGWLPLAIVAAGGTLWQIVTPTVERNWSRLIRVWLIGAVTAFALWSPVLWDCRKIGGYAAVAANHRRYVDGFAKWGENLLRGYQNMDEFVGITLIVGFVFCASAARDLSNRSSSSTSLGAALVFTWFAGLLVATPVYVPYSRLWEPWLISACLLLAPIVRFTWPLRSLANALEAGVLTATLITAVTFCGMVLSPSNWLAWPTSWESRDGALAAANEIRAKIADSKAAVFVQSEPAVWFHLRQQGQAAVIADGLKFLNQPLPTEAYLVVGPQAERDPEFARDREALAARLEPVAEFTLQPSRIVLLDQFSPQELAEHPARRTMTLRLFRAR